MPGLNLKPTFKKVQKTLIGSCEAGLKDPVFVDTDNYYYYYSIINGNTFFKLEILRIQLQKVKEKTRKSTSSGRNPKKKTKTRIIRPGDPDFDTENANYDILESAKYSTKNSFIDALATSSILTTTLIVDREVSLSSCIRSR